MKEEEEDSATLVQFRSSLSQFALGASPTKDQPELRRSPRKSRPLTSEQDSPSRREAKPYSPSRSPKKKRAYAAPETYGHLRQLNDQLTADLDVIFCGINPGQKSAETGHHFGHPSNHFWWCLHQSGFTDTKLSPTEDFTLPDRFSLGLTNLVDRPTAEVSIPSLSSECHPTHRKQTELSADEQSASVPAFLAKVARFRPRVVCFVGLNIAQVVESSLQRTKSLKLKHAKTSGLRQYKMIHPSPSKYCRNSVFRRSEYFWLGNTVPATSKSQDITRT
ncbi:uracil-DNA glycosylase-like protein [Roridomyces roridus]|uniref:Uracil-DNA glycosylase-like protein n=1 Tax=Roridomyces roridus TaxID=1738132 RepID=A0AAD7BX45_9AGAR|nr:uracil-DNA glycosylase-like protein [Roridomyces roridus]